MSKNNKGTISKEIGMTQKDTKKEKEKDGVFLWFSVVVVCMGMISSGCAFIWTSPMLPLLKSNDSTINPINYEISPYEESLIAGLLSFGGMLGTFFIGMLADIYGRKRTLIFFSIIDFLSVIIMSFGNNVYYFYIPRFLQGLNYGFAVTILPLYVAEITEDHNRGKFGSFVGLFFIVGNLYGYSIGPLFNLRTYTLLCGTPLLINIVVFTLFIPESPVWLVTKKHSDKAISALQQLRNLNVTDAAGALEEIKHILKATAVPNKGLKQLKQVPGLTKTLVVSVVVNMLQQASGICAVLGFLGPIFDSAKFKLSGNTAAILVEFIQVLAVIASSFLIERLGRRFLILVSTALGFASLVVLGLYFYFNTFNSDFTETLLWLPFVCLVLFMIGYGFGLGPVPMVFTSEIFANDFKSIAASISHFFSGLMASLAVFSFPLIADILGIWWCFWVFGAVCGFGVIFVYIWMPETKGKNLVEIQNLFN